ncbi:MAG: hypothetical protein ABR597_11275 [Bacteroidales bacterium]
MNKIQITYNAKEQSKEESLLHTLKWKPADRLTLFLEMSEFYLNLYPPKKPETDNNFHIYPNE